MYGQKHRMSLLPRSVIQAARRMIPPIDNPLVASTLRKGQSGRILVIGGSEEYTGAPYYSAISAARTGADIVHVVCDPRASSAIKSYSPELIVHPLLDPKTGVEDSVAKVLELAKRVHIVVLGPGLSRDDFMQNTAAAIVEALRDMNKPLVLDADGLFLVQNRPKIVKGFK
ncbi:carbohydrate kinase-domain-containing protein [Chytriomyces sp. MP71]|nr:carbohydrate kinase-domain-containing protein [Chytriomyces sp. MP71]